MGPPGARGPGPGAPSNALRAPGPGAPLRAGYVETFFLLKNRLLIVFVLKTIKIEGIGRCHRSVEIRREKNVFFVYITSLETSFESSYDPIIIYIYIYIFIYIYI